ncbi:hypothetical protein niasHT_035116 [Heterodera trifolii]|uniref:CCHC-type domain-containing protein n=1 Tax=Heterodera trifolii TaxID=157864 RepID=A0ABD2IZ64_9BILA
MMVRHTPDNEDDPLDMLNDAFGLPLTSSVVEDPDRHAEDQLPVRADTLEPMNNGPNDEKVPRNPGGQSQRNRRPPQRFSPVTLKKYWHSVPLLTRHHLTSFSLGICRCYSCNKIGHISRNSRLSLGPKPSACS